MPESSPTRPARLRPLLLLALAACACACALAPRPSGQGSEAASADPPPAPRPPNILLLFADDQRADTVAAWGNEAIRTPNLDRLARRGFSFRRAYNLGSVHGAVCMPSRAMLHTGLPYFGMNLSTFDGAPTLGALLHEAGYYSFGTGKWHNGRETFARSFDEGRAVFFGGMCDHTQVPLIDLVDGEYGAQRTGMARSSELFADAAVNFLEHYQDDAPFFCYVAFTAPHDPRDPPERFLEHYRENPPPLPANFAPQHPFDNGFLTVRDEMLAPWPRSEAVISQQLQEYYGLIEHLDEQLGRVLDALAARGELENTLVVYAADHGLALGSHGLVGKQSLYEHSIGTPLILAGPGVPVGGASRTPVYLLDLFPTLLGQAGAEQPPGRPGHDLLPICRGEQSALRETIGFSMGTSIRAVRAGRWKLIRYPKIDRTQLFDLDEDPDERVDLAAEPEQAARIAELLAELRAWQAEMGDDLPLSVAEPAPAVVDLSDTPREPDRWQPAWIRAKYFGQE